MYIFRNVFCETKIFCSRYAWHKLIRIGKKSYENFEEILEKLRDFEDIY